jgi:predicted nucleic acid-binding protein
VTLVADASLVVSALIDSTSTGTWAESLLASAPLCAPHLMPAEVASILRRATATGDISPDVASMAHADLAEYLDATIDALDPRLARATGPRCAFAVPPAAI